MSRPRKPENHGKGAIPSAKEIFASRRNNQETSGRAGRTDTKKDRETYREAVKYLQEKPEEIPAAWFCSSKHPAGILFSFCSPDRKTHYFGNQAIGCPMMIRCNSFYVAWTFSLTEKIRCSSLPLSAEGIDKSHLSLLANLQIEMDLTFRDPQWREQNLYAMVSFWPGDRVEEEEIDWC